MWQARRRNAHHTPRDGGGRELPPLGRCGGGAPIKQRRPPAGAASKTQTLRPHSRPLHWTAGSLSVLHLTRPVGQPARHRGVCQKDCQGRWRAADSEVGGLARQAAVQGTGVVGEGCVSASHEGTVRARQRPQAVAVACWQEGFGNHVARFTKEVDPDSLHCFGICFGLRLAASSASAARPNGWTIMGEADPASVAYITGADHLRRRGLSFFRTSLSATVGEKLVSGRGHVVASSSLALEPNLLHPPIGPRGTMTKAVVAGAS